MHDHGSRTRTLLTAIPGCLPAKQADEMEFVLHGSPYMTEIYPALYSVREYLTSARLASIPLSGCDVYDDDYGLAELLGRYGVVLISAFGGASNFEIFEVSCERVPPSMPSLVAFVPWILI